MNRSESDLPRPLHAPRWLALATAVAACSGSDDPAVIDAISVDAPAVDSAVIDAAACSEPCAGACNPAGRCVLLLAQGRTNPHDVAVSADTVFWAEHSLGSPALGRIVRTPKVGGALSIVAEPQSAPYSLVIGAADVYWASTDLMSAPLAGGPARVLVAGASPHVLALTDDAIYYSRFSRDIWRFPLPNGPAERVAEMQSGAFSLGVDGQALYWRASASVIDGVTANRAIVRMPLAGGPPAVVRMNEPYVLGRMVFRGGFAYMSIDEAVDGLRRVPLDGGPPTMLLEQAVGPPIVDETSVYYFEGGNVIADGMLKKVPLDGFGPPVVLAWNLHRPSSIAVDATSAYVTTEHGAVLKLTPK